MAKVLFISERSIKENSVIETNTDSKIVRLTVAEVQDLELLNIIGKKVYKELEDEVIAKNEDSNYEIPENYVEMLEVIKPFLIYGTLANLMVPLTYKITNKGAVVKDDTSATTTDGSQMQYVMNYYRTKFDAYKQRLIDDFGKRCGNEFMDRDLGYSTGWYLGTKDKNKKVWLDRWTYKY